MSVSACSVSLIASVVNGIWRIYSGIYVVNRWKCRCGVDQKVEYFPRWAEQTGTIMQEIRRTVLTPRVNQIVGSRINSLNAKKEKLGKIIRDAANPKDVKNQIPVRKKIRLAVIRIRNRVLPRREKSPVALRISPERKRKESKLLQNLFLFHFVFCSDFLKIKILYIS